MKTNHSKCYLRPFKDTVPFNYYSIHWIPIIIKENQVKICPIHTLSAKKKKKKKKFLKKPKD